MKDIFGRELCVGDFVLFTPYKCKIDVAHYGIITPFNTIYYSITYNPYPSKDSFLEEKLEKFSGFYKLDLNSLDEAELGVYNHFLSFYTEYVNQVNAFELVKSDLPVGTIFKFRKNCSYAIYLYLGKYSTVYRLYEILRNEEFLSDFFCLTGKRDGLCHYYLSLYASNVDNMLDILLSYFHGGNLFEFFKNFSQDYNILTSKSKLKDLYIIGQIDLSNLNLFHHPDFKKISNRDVYYENDSDLLCLTDKEIEKLPVMCMSDFLKDSKLSYISGISANTSYYIFK